MVGPPQGGTVPCSTLRKVCETVRMSMNPGLQAIAVNINAVWPDDTLEGAAAVNQFIVVPAINNGDGSPSGDVYLVAGFADPPFNFREDALREAPPEPGVEPGTRVFDLPIKPRAKLYLSRQRLLELRDVLTTVIEATDGGQAT